MKTRLGTTLATLAVAFASAGILTLSAPVTAQERAPAEGSDRYGSPAGDMPYEEDIRLSANTRAVGVMRRQTVRFVTAEGKEFRWRFDTFAPFEVFPLAAIAPEGVAVPAGAMVYVNGDIPIGGRGR